MNEKIINAIILFIAFIILSLIFAFKNIYF